MPSGATTCGQSGRRDRTRHCCGTRCGPSAPGGCFRYVISISAASLCRRRTASRRCLFRSLLQGPPAQHYPPSTGHALAQLEQPGFVFNKFRSLIERAFRSHSHLEPTVFELQGEGGLPEPHLLMSRPFSIVKVHGGRHQMRAGTDLDQPLSSGALGAFRRFVDQLTRSHGRPLMVMRSVLTRGSSPVRVCPLSASLSCPVISSMPWVSVREVLSRAYLTPHVAIG